MGKNASPKPDNTPQTSSEAPFTTFIQLDGKSPVPSQFRTPGTFTITRLQSPAGLPDRITKLSPVPALLVSISLKSLPSSSYQVWTADKLIPTAIHPFVGKKDRTVHPDLERAMAKRMGATSAVNQILGVNMTDWKQYAPPLWFCSPLMNPQRGCPTLRDFRRVGSDVACDSRN